MPPQIVSESSFEIEVFFDGECPLCAKEIAMLQRRDKHGRIQFTDIADPTFDPSETGQSFQALMAEIHGRLPDGELITGVEVFRRLYTAIGFGWIVSLTRLPLISHALGLGYSVFAKWRYKRRRNCQTGICDVQAS